MSKIEITKDKFRKYLEVQIEGKYNMNQVGIEDIIGITRKELSDIQVNYNFYCKQFESLKEEIEQEFFDKIFTK